MFETPDAFNKYELFSKFFLINRVISKHILWKSIHWSYPTNAIINYFIWWRSWSRFLICRNPMCLLKQFPFLCSRNTLCGVCCKWELW